MIGFAFRDEHFNSLFADNLPPQTDILVINPDRNAGNAAERAVRLDVRSVGEHFDQVSVSNCIEEVAHVLGDSKG